MSVFAKAAAAQLAAAALHAPVERRFRPPAAPPVPAFRIRRAADGGWEWWCTTAAAAPGGGGECGTSGTAMTPCAAAESAVAHLTLKHDLETP
ncbi:hypothetical protein [Streptomyces alboflavus]|uniref:hypothetical protein n=1 Tax=Streptomyces alboflavus TaxID=67267 RepID=UPI0036AD5D48